jgi:hypothetical protein
MASAPDILVTALDSPRILLVVEAKFTVKDLTDVERALKRYIVKMGVPVGLLITPKLIGIYRNQYTGKSESSVERVNLFDFAKMAPSLLRLFQNLPEDRSDRKTSNAGLVFEENVQSWLENLRISELSNEIAPELQDAISDYILPALNKGVIRAAHPREYST